MSGPINILFIASRSDIAGGEIYLLSLFDHLDRTRYTPFVMLPGDGAFRVELDQRQIKTLIVSVNYGWLQPPQEWYPFVQDLPRRVRCLSDFIREHDIRLVHSNSSMILEGALAARLTGVRHLYLAHTLFEPQLPIYQRFSLGAASFAELMGELSDAIVAVSDFVKQGLCPPLPIERVQVVRNGVDVQRYREARENGDGARIRHEFGVDSDALLITAAGRLNPDKGFEHIVEAAGQIASQLPNAHFVVAGATDSATYAAWLKRRIDELGLSRRFHLPGFRNDLPELLAGSDIFVLSSKAEGASYVLIEAMASACAVIASRCGGYVDELITSGETGLLTNYADASALAQSILQLAESPASRKRMAEAGLARVGEGGFDIGQSTAKLISVYECLLESPAPAKGAIAIDLFLQAAAEAGDLGSRLTSLEERLKTLEQTALIHPRQSARRWLRKWLKK